MKKILLCGLILGLSSSVFAAQAPFTAIPKISTGNYITTIREAVNTNFGTQHTMNTELYAHIAAGNPWVAQATAPADTTKLWFDTDQVADAVVLKVYTGGVWVQQAIGEGGSMTWPAAAGLAVYGGSSAWGTSLTLDTDLSSVSANDDSVPSAKATKTAFDALPSIIFGTGLTVAEDTPSAGTDTVSVTTNTYQAYDADLTAWAGISPTTGSISTTGAVQAKVPFNSYSTAQTLTAATHNSTVVQMTAAVEATMWDCETANVGDTVMLWARDAEKIEVVPASGDHFVLFDGTALTADYELDTAATAGTKVTLMCTADDTWSVFTETAASTDGGIAD